jgi:hypothetical protein
MSNFFYVSFISSLASSIFFLRMLICYCTFFYCFSDYFFTLCLFADSEVFGFPFIAVWEIFFYEPLSFWWIFLIEPPYWSLFWVNDSRKLFFMFIYLNFNYVLFNLTFFYFNRKIIICIYFFVRLFKVIYKFS